MWYGCGSFYRREYGSGEKLSGNGAKTSEKESEGEGGLYDLRDQRRFLFSDAPRDLYIGACREPGGQRDQKGDEFTVCSDCGECVCIRKVTDHGGIRSVK